MPAFIIILHLPVGFTQEFTSLIPSHRDYVNQLLDEAILETYAISADRTQGWITMQSQTPDTALAVVKQLPLYKFFTQVEIRELMVFDSTTFRFPRVSLN